MISEEEALEKVLSGVEPLGPVEVPLAEGLGRFAARDLVAGFPLPMFDNSAMDGYAVVAASSQVGARLRLVGEQAAGPDRGLALHPGEAIRVFTGAPIPHGADAVVMQEEVSVEAGAIVIGGAVEPGENVRRAGTDLCVGQILVGAGEPLTPQTLALLASQGLAAVTIGKWPTIAVLTTGDEIVPPGEPIAPGRIYDSNGVLIAGLAGKLGLVAARLGVAPDERDPLRERLELALGHDVAVIAGGVSVGERDLVKDVLRDLGARLELWRVAIKPGKPFLYGRRGGCHVFGLPGNPVSAFVTYVQFVRPAILKMMGANPAQWPLPCFPSRTVEKLTNPDQRPHYIRGRVEGGHFAAAGRQESHALYGLSRSNALVRLEPGQTIAAGTEVSVRIF